MAPDKFRLSLDDVEDEQGLFPPEEEPVVRKRSLVGFYLLLTILVVGMAAAYFDLYRRVSRSQTTGFNQLKTLEQQIASLSTRLTALEEQLSQNATTDAKKRKGLVEKVDQAFKSIETVQKQLTKTTGTIKKEIEKIDTRTENNRMKLDAIAVRIEKIEPLGADLETMKSDLAAIKEDLAGEIDEIMLQLDNSSKSIVALKSQTDRLAATRIDKKTAENLIEKHLKGQQPIDGQLVGTLADHGEQIDALKRHLNDLKKNTTIYENEILKIKRQLKTLESDILSKISRISSTPLSPSPAAPVESGGLIQQNLKE